MSAQESQFLRQQQAAATEEAVRAVLGVGEPILTPGEPDEQSQFEAQMRRFPRQHRVVPS